MVPKAQCSNESSPLVRVIVPVYLGAPCVAGTLDSVLAQSLPATKSLWLTTARRIPNVSRASPILVLP